MIPFSYKIIDLTHPLDENIPSWDGACGFKPEVMLDYDQCTTDVKFRVQHITMQAGIGTHMDAPAHCIAGGKCIDDLDLNDLIAPCVVLDVSQRAHERYSVSIQDIESFEQAYGVIQPGTFVMIRTGWERFWGEPDQYRNTYLYPSLASEAACFLLNRGIVGIGIDTLSPDRLEDGFPVHGLLLGAGKYIVENAANLSQLPPHGSFIMVLPIPIKGGTEAPIRLVGLLPR